MSEDINISKSKVNAGLRYLSTANKHMSAFQEHMSKAIKKNKVFDSWSNTTMIDITEEPFNNLFDTIKSGMRSIRDNAIDDTTRGGATIGTRMSNITSTGGRRSPESTSGNISSLSSSIAGFMDDFEEKDKADVSLAAGLAASTATSVGSVSSSVSSGSSNTNTDKAKDKNTTIDDGITAKERRKVLINEIKNARNEIVEFVKNFLDTNVEISDKEKERDEIVNLIDQLIAATDVGERTKIYDEIEYKLDQIVENIHIDEKRQESEELRLSIQQLIAEAIIDEQEKQVDDIENSIYTNVDETTTELEKEEKKKELINKFQEMLNTVELPDEQEKVQEFSDMVEAMFNATDLDEKSECAMQLDMQITQALDEVEIIYESKTEEAYNIKSSINTLLADKVTIYYKENPNKAINLNGSTSKNTSKSSNSTKSTIKNIKDAVENDVIKWDD